MLDAVMPKSELFTLLEQVLVDHPIFGDSDYILDRMITSFQRRLSLIGSKLESAADLLKAIQLAEPKIRRRVIGDTVLRSAIKSAHTEISTNEANGIPLGICDRLFRIASVHLSAERSDFLIDRNRTPMPKIGDEDWHGAIWNQTNWSDWLWDEDPDADIYDRAFRYIVNFNNLGPLSEANDEDLANARRGQQLLEVFLPKLAKNVSQHTQTIALFDTNGPRRNIASSSQYRLPGIIFLSKKTLQNPWNAAANIFHESLHQKLYNLRLGHTLLSETFDETQNFRICSVWNSPGIFQANMWNAHRGMAAFHVYVHLALLALIVENGQEDVRASYGSSQSMISSRQALDRAHHLGNELRMKCGDELGLAGLHFIDWLMSILSELDPIGKPIGAKSHLYVQRYLREASKIASVHPSAEFDDLLLQISKAEVQQSTEILQSLGLDGSSISTSSLLQNISDSERTNERFCRIRNSIADNISECFNASENGARIKVSDENGLLQQMVERSSECLLPILEGASDEVIAAKRLGRQIGFQQSCRDNVGRLLATLSASVPFNGKILEIGTGSGVGVGWILKGLSTRTDVQVVTIESDRSRLDAVQQLSWPNFVNFVRCDVRETLTTIGQFNFVFADASPLKYDDTAAMLDLVDLGGFLVIDDLNSSSSAQQARINKLKDLISGHRDFKTVFFPWDGGMLIATRLNQTNPTLQ